MRIFYHFFLCLIFIVVLNTNGFAEIAQDIMRKNLQRDDGNTQLARVQISSCRTTTKGQKIVCAEKPRTKVLEEVRKDYENIGIDTKQVMIICEPASEKGIGFLQFDYEKAGKESDQWMYFSAMGKVKRIVSGNENKPKTGSFFGTELNYEDIEKRRLLNYEYRLLREETYKEKACNVIESIPTMEYARKSNYSKIWDWIDKENNIRLKTILFDRRGRQVKQITRAKIEKIDGIWTWGTQVVNNLKTQRLSYFKMLKSAFNIPVTNEFLTQRALIDASFREMHLNTYRSNLK